MLHRFGLRTGSAGIGEWRGGEGVVREIEFLEPMQVSILSEVRIHEHHSLNLLYQPFIRGGRDSHTAWKAGVLGA